MIARRVLSRADVEGKLRSLDYEPTPNKTATGTFWRNSTTGKHVLVPFPDDEGMYPDFIIQDLIKHIGKIPTRPIH